jgi:hypothetical protein
MKMIETGKCTLDSVQNNLYTIRIDLHSIIGDNKEIIMAAKYFNPEQVNKMKQLVNEGMAVMQEVETLNGGLSDTVKAIAEELEIKPSILKKAIRIAYKSKLTDTNADHEQLNDILETVGRTL